MAARIEMFRSWLTVLPAESCTCIVKLELLSTLGMPESVPADVNANPIGNTPDARLQEYGLTPPIAASVVEYELPTIPLGIVTLTMARGCDAALMDRLNVSVAVLLAASFTWTAKEKVPVVPGVPEIIPVDARLSPAGKAPEANVQLYGLMPPFADRIVR